MYREIFKEQTGNSFDCTTCRSINKDRMCCPEENDCPVEREYTAWLEAKVDKAIEAMTEYTVNSSTIESGQKTIDFLHDMEEINE